jgi:hypothetical protein
MFLMLLLNCFLAARVYEHTEEGADVCVVECQSTIESREMEIHCFLAGSVHNAGANPYSLVWEFRSLFSRA